MEKLWESQHPDYAVFSGYERLVRELASDRENPANGTLFA
jgi:hypothetical protein